VPEQQPITVSILAIPETSPSTLFGLFDLLSSVGVGWESFVTGKPEAPRFDVRIVTATGDPVQCSGNVTVTPHCAIDDVDQTDIALVTGLIVPAFAPFKERYDREFEWLVRQSRRGAITSSACTGALMLAESGILDGWEATTHWAYRNLFRIHYPNIRLRLEKNLCGTGHENQIVTSGGVTAWQELALHFITRFCGIEYTTRTAKFWLIPDRQEGQAPFESMSKNIQHDDAVVHDCQVWVADHYVVLDPVSAMTAQSGLPPTTFARRFKRATGYRPIDYVHTLRVEEAKEMLERSDASIDQIGRDVGYEDPASFRRLFKRKAGVTPSIYRRRFGHRRFDRYDLPH
jgi:transcriptional regulator GlxA family with amidase domain